MPRVWLEIVDAGRGSGAVSAADRALNPRVAAVVERASLTKRYHHLETSGSVVDALELTRHRIATRTVEIIPLGPKAQI